jgi:hypothetical protein
MSMIENPIGLFFDSNDAGSESEQPPPVPVSGSRAQAIRERERRTRPGQDQKPLVFADVFEVNNVGPTPDRVYGGLTATDTSQRRLATAVSAFPDIASMFPASGRDEQGNLVQTSQDIARARFGDTGRLDAFRQQGLGSDPDAAAFYAQDTFHALDGKNLFQAQQWLNHLDFNDPEGMAQFQQELWDAGYYRGKEPALWGRFDTATQDAVSFLFNDSYMNTDWTIAEILNFRRGTGEALDAASGRGGGFGGGGGGAREPAYEQASADSLSVLVDQVSSALIGRRISDEEKSTIISKVQSQQLAEQQAAYAAQQTGGTYTLDSADTIIGGQVMNQFNDEYGATQYSQHVNVMRSMLGGI